MTADATLQQAMQYHQAGALAQAEYLYRQILQSNPRDADVLHLLGVMAFQVGRPETALPYFQQAIASSPEKANFHSNLGRTYQALGRLDDSLASYREALRLKPDLAETCNNLGNVLRDLNRLEEAATTLRQALRLQPNLGEAHNNLGTVLFAQGNLEEAAACFEGALRIKPDYAPACTNLGNVLGEQGKVNEAVDWHRKAVRLQPEFAEAHHNLGAALRDQVGPLAVLRDPTADSKLDAALHYQNTQEEAITSQRQALRLQPNFAEAHAHLGHALSDLLKHEEALTAYEAALRLKPTPGLRIHVATLLPPLYRSKEELHFWRTRLTNEVGRLREEKITRDLTNEAATALFYLAYQGLNDRDLQSQIAGLYTAPQQVLGSASASPRSPNGKIKVGFISKFFRTHTIGHWIRGLIAQLPREDLEVTVLSVGRHDDAIGSDFKKHADRFLEVPKQLPAARRLIAEQNLDVLFYTDIGLDSFTYTLAFSRLAPVQCVTVGHPVTTGIGAIDYYISSEQLEIPEAQEHYTEKLVRLKTLPVYFYRPTFHGPLKQKQDFGLANGGHVYACLQTPYKFHPEFDELLGGILRGDPQGTVVLSRWSVPPWQQRLRERFATTLPDVADRIHFLPVLAYQDYLQVLALADVQLDTLHFGGGMTSYEGLSLGTPIVTLPTQFSRGRITSSLYKQMQLMDCVASSRQEYINLALQLGTDPAYRASMREKILAANDVLFENSTGVRELEQFLRQAAGRARAGKGPLP
jgi:protein O-GlcNAc transferase